ncbi:hypothetical protein [Pararhizobium sp. IMCC21322]|uniref:hypothetical protein n=1 Tax=Pararhizobium sp. IMCC21322 TaxID=3067903 RepID=UPI002741F9D4|nr:hypothetical protein [Pararhizobium sp. IMCC21322]
MTKFCGVLDWKTEEYIFVNPDNVRMILRCPEHPDDATRIVFTNGDHQTVKGVADQVTMSIDDQIDDPLG